MTVSLCELRGVAAIAARIPGYEREESEVEEGVKKER